MSTVFALHFIPMILQLRMIFAVAAILLAQILLTLLLSMHRKPVLIHLLLLPRVTPHLEGVRISPLAVLAEIRISCAFDIVLVVIVAGAGLVTLGSPDSAAFGFFDEGLEDGDAGCYYD